MGRSRKENCYRDTNSKDGIISTRIEKDLADKVRRYCMENNLNKTTFINECVQMRMDNIEKELLTKMSKEELIGIIVDLKREKNEDKEQLSLNI